jgi:hypothetical protein
MNLTPRPITDTSEDPRGLSTFDAPERAAPPNGGKVQVIDTERLRTLITVEDRANPGHVTIRPVSQEELDEWAASRGREDVVHPLTREVQEAIIDEGRIRP